MQIESYASLMFWSYIHVRRKKKKDRKFKGPIPQTVAVMILQEVAANFARNWEWEGNEKRIVIMGWLQANLEL